MPEQGQHNSARWRVDGWSLRSKVAVVLMLPAVVALVLGGARVKSQLDDASRLSTVRDQLAVLRDSVTLAELVAKEMVTAASSAPDLNARKSATDEGAAAIQRSADFARLPTGVSRILGDALGRLGALRQPAGAKLDVIAQINGYHEVVNGLSGLVPGVVSQARQVDLDESARSVSSLMLLRATLATEDALLRSTRASAIDSATAAAAQHAAAEEAVLGEQLLRDIPDAKAATFGAATTSAPSRRDVLQAALAGTRVVEPQALLPALETESATLNGLLSDLVNTLADDVSVRTNQARSDALRDAAIVLGALLAALAIALVVARSLLAPVRRLRQAALAAAHHQLPATVERVRAGEQFDYTSIEAVPVHTGEEIGQLARAFDDMHQQAVRLAGEQAELRRQVSDMFMTLSRRSQSLVELQLHVIDGLESDEQDPKRLEGLFRLDHLATRLRRNAENLQVLAGGTPARRGQEPVTIVELLRAATSEVNDYRRVSLGHAPNGSIRASAAADVVHILAELLENATRFSPPERKVVLTADRGSDGGLLIEVVDAGLGMAADDLAAANARLAAVDAVGPETTRRMGLFVVSRLAARHGVMVRLRPTHDAAKRAGITASVHLPGAVVIADRSPVTVVPPEVRKPELVKELPPAVSDWPGANWFADLTDVGNGTVPEPAAAADDWLAPAGKAWHTASPPVQRAGTPDRAAGPAVPAAANPAEKQAPASGTTTAGLPVRKPGARVIPAEPAPEPTAPRIGFRDPESIRSNLSRHYDGVRAARQRTRTEPEPTQNGRIEGGP